MKQYNFRFNFKQKHIAAVFLALSVLSAIYTLIVYNEEIQERPLLASLDLKSGIPSEGIKKYLTPDDNAVRIVARHESRNADEVPLKLELIKDGFIIISNTLKPKSTTGYAKGFLRREEVRYWDYGAFNIKSDGKYIFKIFPERSLVEFDVFDIFISTKNSENLVRIWLFISAVLFIIGLYFGRNIRLTLKQNRL
ncbi:MAG: hypothetical protein QNJ58_21515 [Desulfobacterales bacterium]|nr:hypothetical protein [Desulfobacterales bacterium]